MAAKTTTKKPAKKTASKTPQTVDEISKALADANATGNTLPGTPVGGTLPPTTPATATPNAAAAGGTSSFGAALGANGLTGNGTANAGNTVAGLLLGTGWTDLTATDPALLNLTGLDTLIGVPTGPVPGAAGQNRPKTAIEVMRWARNLTPQQFANLQRSLYAAGFYDSSWYSSGQTPPKDRLADTGWEDALWAAMQANAQSFDGTKNPTAFGALVTARMKANAPILEENAKKKAAAAAAETASIEAQKKRDEADAAAQAAALAKLGPDHTMDTQFVALSNPLEIANTAQDVAVKMLGRRLTPEEEQAYVTQIGDAEKAYLSRQADLKAYNAQLGWEFPAGTATNPQQNVASAQPSAPDTQYMSPGSIPKGTPGFGQLTNSKTNQNAASAFVAMNQKYGVGFLGIVGDEAHKQRESDHNTWDAVDMGVKNSSVGWNVANDLVSQAQALNVKYVIFQNKIWSPDKGWHAYTGTPHDGHVHASFNRGAATTATGTKPATAATPVAGSPTADQLAEALALEESGNTNIMTKASGSSASGFFQITNATWGGFGGYKRAIDAPRDVQKQRAVQLLDSYLKKYNGNVDHALAAYYVGGGHTAAQLQKLIDGNVNPTAGTKTANKEMQKFLSDVKTQLPKVGATATALGSQPAAATGTLGGVGGSLARGVTPYQGAVATPSGGSVLYGTDPASVATTVEADLRKNNPAGVAANALTGARSVFQQLFGGI